jgi:hypothetical protein
MYILYSEAVLHMDEGRNLVLHLHVHAVHAE